MTEEKLLYWAKSLEHKSLSVHELVENAKWLLSHQEKPAEETIEGIKSKLTQEELELMIRWAQS